ncbi:hypothetical protein N9N36_00275 [Gammaproteobacteria bacterium]|nr:hypothetical protein [Gammaproteobacteria bacterium]
MKEPYLYQCTKSDCGTFFWHRNVLKEFNNKEKPDSDNNKAIEKDIIKKFKIPKGYGRSAYVIKLSRKEGEEQKAVYVGETGHHPLRRYLQHLRGYKSGKGHATKRATYLLDFELGVKDSKKREKEWAKELESIFLVKGGH